MFSPPREKQFRDDSAETHSGPSVIAASSDDQKMSVLSSDISSRDQVSMVTEELYDDAASVMVAGEEITMNVFTAPMPSYNYPYAQVGNYSECVLKCFYA